MTRVAIHAILSQIRNLIPIRAMAKAITAVEHISLDLKATT